MPTAFTCVTTILMFDLRIPIQPLTNACDTFWKLMHCCAIRTAVPPTTTRILRLKTQTPSR